MARVQKTFQGKHDTAHAWAQQNLDEGKERASILRLFFEGPTIYSYGRHFPIATFHTKKDGSRAVIFTTRKYSNTTSAHIQAARGAIAGEHIIYCENPIAAIEGRHAENMEAWEKQARNAALGLPKCRKPERFLAAISSARREMEAYAEYFKVGKRQFKFKYLYVESKDGGTKATEAEIKAQAKAEKLRAARAASALKQEIAAFRGFETDAVNGDHTFTYLRYCPNTRDIQTSKRVQIPYGEAHKAYREMKGLQAKADHHGDDYRGKGIQIFGYPLRRVTTMEFEVGCHRITFQELDAIGQQLGWREIPPMPKTEMIFLSHD